MATNPTDAPSDDFLQEILGLQSFAPPDPSLVAPDSSQSSMLLHLRSSAASPHLGPDAARFHGFPLGLSFEHDKPADGLGFLKGELPEGSCGAKRFREEDAAPDVFRCQPLPAAANHPPPMRPRVRARRGQATDPHSIAERLRRERIAERIKALQELVPSVNKTDRAAMLDEIVDYVKFLRLQVKVLSMSRLGGAGAVAPLVTDIPLEEADDSERNQPAWEKWSSDGTERHVAKLMEENVGTAMQFLQSKALCIMPISLASAIFRSQLPETSIKPETRPGS